MNIRSLVHVLLLLTVSCIAAYAQAPQGLETSPLPLGPDSIYLPTLDTTLTIPIRNKVGRGLPFSASLQYSPQVYTLETSTGQLPYAWIPNAGQQGGQLNWGWALVTGQVNANILTEPNSLLACPSPNATESYLSYGPYTYTDAQGIEHGFNETWNTLGYCFSSTYTPSAFTVNATDGSGIVLSCTFPNWSQYPGSISCQVTLPTGVVITPAIMNANGTPTTVQDANGNEIIYPTPATNTQTLPWQGTYTDTLGTVALDVENGTCSDGWTCGLPSYLGTLQYCQGANATAAACAQAGGTLQTYTATYELMAVETDFGCSQTAEYVNESVPLITSLSLPDGRKYTFAYQSSGTNTIYGQSYSTVTGMISEVTLPSGGTISYAYSQPNCATGGYNQLVRTVNDNNGNNASWTYTASAVNANSQMNVTIQDPAVAPATVGSKTILTYQTGEMPYPDPYAMRYFLLGSTTSDSSGVLSTTAISYPNNTNGPAPLVGPITEEVVNTSLPSAPGSTSQVTSQQVLTFATNGLETEVQSYDYGAPGSSSPGSLLSKTLITYPASGTMNYALPSSVTTYDSTGSNVTGQTNYFYDQYSSYPLVATSGTPNHASGVNSGNVTTIQKLASSGNYQVLHYRYYDTGLVYQATDVNAAVTTYSQTACGNSLPASQSTPVTSPSGSVTATLTSSATWDCYGGVQLTSTDVNGNTTTYAYSDPYWRLTTRTDPLGNATHSLYPTQYSAMSSTNETFRNGSTGISIAETYQTYDGLGRPILTQRIQGPTATQYDSASTVYNPLGQVAYSSQPYSATLGTYSKSGPGTTTAYDGLGRPLTVTDGGGGVVSYAYLYNDTKVTVGPAPSGENVKSRQLEYNGSGQLTSVCEITSALGGTGTCAQNTSASGYLTKYTYDGPYLTKSSQNAQSGSSGVQTRTMTYDDLGRKLTEVLPETGTTTSVYDSDSSGVCAGTSTGDVIKSTDNMQNVTCYSYDSLHRPLSAYVKSGPYASVTPQVNYVYDAASLSGSAMQNVKGALAEAYTCATGSTCSPKLTDYFNQSYPYTSGGSQTGQTVSQTFEATPHSSGYIRSQVISAPNGAAVNLLAQCITCANPMLNINYTLDGEGRPYTATDVPSGNTLLGSTTYNTASSPLVATLGNSSTDSYQYDVNTNRPTGYQFAIPGSSAFTVSGTPSWNPNGTLKGLAITDTNDSTKNQSCSYSRDDLNRLATVSCPGAWAQNFSYDAFGNINKAAPNGAPQGTSTGVYSATYCTASNQLNSACTATSYDGDGNQMTGGANSYTWNAAGQAVTVTGTAGTVTATYDALGRVVETGVGSSYSQTIYSPGGSRLGTVQGTTLLQGLVPLPGGGTAVYAGGSVYARHRDFMGNSRLTTTISNGIYSKESYAPFGESYFEAGTPDRSFAGAVDQDTTAGIYDAYFRRLDSGAGRWISPDPAGWGSASLTNPQSLNRYVYALNDPMSYVDPSGLDDECDYDASDSCDPFGGGPGPDPDPDAPVDLLKAPLPQLPIEYITAVAYDLPCVYDASCIVTASPEVLSLIPNSFLNWANEGITPSAAPNKPVVLKNPCLYRGNSLPPSTFAQAGQDAKGNPVALTLDAFLGFPAGDYLDGQALASGNPFQNQAYGNYTFGVYTQAAGIPLPVALAAASAYALKGKIFNPSQYANQDMDPSYPMLPAASVANIINGFKAQAGGTTCKD